MTKPNPIVILGAVFLLGMASLVFGGEALSRMQVPLFWLGHLLLAFIPAALVLLLVALVPSDIHLWLALLSLAQLGLLGGGSAHVCRRLLRVSAGAAFFGTGLFYLLTCYGTNRLWMLGWGIPSMP